MQVVDAMHAAIRIDDAVAGIETHAGRADVMVVAEDPRVDRVARQPRDLEMPHTQAGQLGDDRLLAQLEGPVVGYVEHRMEAGAAKA